MKTMNTAGPLINDNGDVVSYCQCVASMLSKHCVSVFFPAEEINSLPLINVSTYRDMFYVT